MDQTSEETTIQESRDQLPNRQSRESSYGHCLFHAYLLGFSTGIMCVGLRVFRSRHPMRFLWANKKHLRVGRTFRFLYFLVR